MNSDNQALWDVVRVALVCMMFIQICGIYYDAITYVPEAAVQVIYDCRFQMDGSIMSKPCTIMGKWEE